MEWARGKERWKLGRRSYFTEQVRWLFAGGSDIDADVLISYPVVFFSFSIFSLSVPSSSKSSFLYHLVLPFLLPSSCDDCLPRSSFFHIPLPYSHDVALKHGASKLAAACTAERQTENVRLQRSDKNRPFCRKAAGPRAALSFLFFWLSGPFSCAC